MTRVTRAEWYRRVNAAWPATVPPLTPHDAVRAARRLYRYGRGRTWRGEVKVTSGNRHTWVRRGVLYVNPEHGWHSLVHFLSHYCAPGVHGVAHARMELRMIKAVVRRGWLDGKLNPAPKAPRRAPTVSDVRAARRARIEERIRRWTTRERRAKTMLAKLRRSLRYYDRIASAAAPEAA